MNIDLLRRGQELGGEVTCTQCTEPLVLMTSSSPTPPPPIATIATKTKVVEKKFPNIYDPYTSSVYRAERFECRFRSVMEEKIMQETMASVRKVSSVYPLFPLYP